MKTTVVDRARSAQIIVATLIFAASWLVPVAQAQSVQRLLFPAYENPCCNAGPAMWRALIDWGQESPETLAVIFNPSSGPGSSFDPNYINANGSGPLVDLFATGATLYGYIYTDFARRPLADVFRDLQLYDNPSYWQGTNVRLDGFFIDEMSNDLANVGYYQSIRDFIRQLSRPYTSIGNPGVSSVFDSSGQSAYSVVEYATVFDSLIVFEGNFDSYTNGYTAPVWQQGLPISSFGHIIHGAQGSDGMMQSLLWANMRGAGLVYVTDDVQLNPFDNPYNRLPSYFAALRNYFREMPQMQCQVVGPGGLPVGVPLPNPVPPTPPVQPIGPGG